MTTNKQILGEKSTVMRVIVYVGVSAITTSLFYKLVRFFGLKRQMNKLTEEFPEVIHGSTRKIIDRTWFYYSNVEICGGDRESPQKQERWTLDMAKNFVETTPWCYAVEYDNVGGYVWFKEKMVGKMDKTKGCIYIHIKSALQCIKDQRKMESETELENAEFVCEKMAPLGWKHARSTTCKVRNLGGESPLTEAVLAIKSNAGHVVLKRYNESPMRNKRMFCASALFADFGCAPKPIASGNRWIIEPFHGGKINFVPGIKRERMAQLAARIHAIPTKWFHPFRNALINKYPSLSVVPSDSCLWPCIAFNSSGIEKFSQKQIEQLCAVLPVPISTAGSREVTSHGDLHKRNTVLTSSGVLLVVDFEFTCVSNATHDLIYHDLGSAEKRRRLCLAYLMACNFSVDYKEIDQLVFDVMVLRYVHFEILRPLIIIEDLHEIPVNFQQAINILRRIQAVIEAVRKNHDILIRIVNEVKRSEVILESLINKCKVIITNEESFVEFEM